MTSRAWDRVNELFDEWSDLDAEGRPAFRHRLTSEDPDVREEIEGMLRHAEIGDSGFLDEPAFGIVESAGDLSRLFEAARGGAPPADEFPAGSGRFEVLRRVGSGGMGAVFEVFDRRLGMRVAAKTLRNVTPTGIALFKEEFRSLARIHHPNLAVLHEFFSEDNAWFFTMEFVDGDGLMTYVDRPRGEALAMPGRIVKIRAVLNQLFEGITAIHAAGKLHRDIKPGNILVTRDGRLVLLDFGLITEAAVVQEHPAPFAGTAAWMSPEHLRGGSLSAASDWYAVGVVLYEMLTGRLPATAANRLKNDGSSESEVVPPGLFAALPEDLSELCLALLALNPEDRPAESEIARRIGHPEGRGLRRSLRSGQEMFGRDEEMGVLAGACDRLGRGECVPVLIQGQSGIGKSFLVNTFLEKLAGRGETMVLRGRCYERESVPFNALDSVIDDLGRRLRGLGQEQLELLVPPDVAALCEVFPVLDWLLTPDRPRLQAADRLQLQKRAFHAFRDLMGRISRTTPTAVFIDDLHWGDTDSALMLNELLREPGAPPLLLIVAHRREPGNESRCMSALMAGAETTALARSIQLTVAPLSGDASEQLAESRLPESAKAEWRAAIAADSHGNPFFIEEMAAWVAGAEEGPVRPPAGGLSLNAMLGERAAQLPPPAILLLEMVALSGEPVRAGEAIEAAQIGEGGLSALSVLRTRDFVRAATPSTSEFLEPFHNRVRESVLAAIPAGRRRDGHARLAATIERSRPAAFETIAFHFEGAGESRRAGGYFEKAARAAAEALAFGRASRLFARALELSDYEPAQRRAVNREMAEALANAGLALEAARAYAEASDGATEEGAICLSRSGYHYAASGHVAESKKTFDLALKQLGLRHGVDPSFTLPRLLFVRALNARARLRPVKPGALNPASDRRRNRDLARIDALWFVGSGLGLVELTTGALFTSLSLRLALRAGDPFRIVRGLAWEAAIEASQSRSGKVSAERIFEVCREYLRHIDDPYAFAMLSMTEGQACFSHGRWADALSRFQRAEELFSAHCKGVGFELTTLRAFRLQTLVFQGDYSTLRATTEGLLDDARSNRDRRAETFILGGISPLLSLAADRPDQARMAIRRALEGSPARGYHLQHALIAQVKIAVELYAGDSAAASAVIHDEWPRMRGGGLLFNQNLRAKLLEARARCALAQVQGSDDPAAVAEQLANEREPYMEGSVLALRAAVQKGRRGQDAEQMLEDAAAAFRRWDMNDHAASARFTLAEWRCAPPAENALSWFAGQKIENPARWARMRLPDGGIKPL